MLWRPVERTVEARMGEWEVCPRSPKGSAEEVLSVKKAKTPPPPSPPTLVTPLLREQFDDMLLFSSPPTDSEVLEFLRKYDLKPSDGTKVYQQMMAFQAQSGDQPIPVVAEAPGALEAVPAHASSVAMIQQILNETPKPADDAVSAADVDVVEEEPSKSDDDQVGEQRGCTIC